MNFRKRQPSLPQFQMTAMMDIVFLLLCFFVTSTVFSQWEYTMSIQLPAASSGSVQVAATMSIETKLNIDHMGVVTVNGVTYSGKALDDFLMKLSTWSGPDDVVIVRADARTTYEDFVKVVDACKRAGIQNLSLSTVEKPDVVENIPELPTL